MISKCVDCAEFTNCNVASSGPNSCVLFCPYYKQGIENPCNTMKLIGKSYLIVSKETEVKIRRNAKQIVDDQSEIMSQVKNVFKSLPELFTATDYKDACILLTGKKIALTKEIKKKYLKSNGKGFYINQIKK